ncbi:MAG: hypothetical protein GF410_02620 [Chitinivibrionales bacterium]|nr:hypothetical protein [Chitinivibrionales bacterium]
MPNKGKHVFAQFAIVALFVVTNAQQPSFGPLDAPRDIVRLTEEKDRFYRQKGYTPLHGSIESASLEPATFVLIDELVIGRGIDLRFAAGSRILCENGARIRINGKLIALGTSNRPVVFASLPASEYCFPVQTDDTLWNGITVEDSAALYCERVHIGDCDAGVDILSENCSVRFRETVFRNTGRYSIRVDGREVRIAEDEPVTWLWPEVRESGELTFVRGAGAGGHARWKWPARIGFAAIAAGGIGLAAASEYLVRKYSEDFSSETDPARADKLHTRAERAARLRTMGIVAGGVGAVGFTVTFFF